MATWRVWIGSPRLGLAEWKPYVVTAKDREQAVREAYKKITGLTGEPTPSWRLWNVQHVELLND